MHGGTHFAGDVVLDGADEDCLARGGVQQRLGEKCGGGLAVGAGDADGGQLALGMAKERGRGLGQRAASVLDFKGGRTGFVNGQVVEGVRRVSDDAERAGGNRFIDDIYFRPFDPPFIATKTVPGRTRRESY